ncbi:MAG: CD225/dispanin family protein [Muribaculaceae bacterium]|nr:CD225/dispanin family protein [Muribaculaceae bacterium]
MKIWIHVNGMQQGPYTMDQIAAMQLSPGTPVWYEGLPRWVPACQAPALASLFADGSDSSDSGEADSACAADAQCVCEPAAQQSGGHGAAAAAVQAACVPARPSTYLAWSIVLTMCCCTPFSIAAIVCGAITNSRYNRGDYAGARRMSHATEWLVIISITLGIVGLPLSMLMYM